MSAPRVTDAQVRAAMGEPATTEVGLGIESAHILVDELLLGKGLSESLLGRIELYLAAHFTHLSLHEGPVASESLGEASERTHNIFSAGLGSSRYGQQAMLLDTSKTLTQHSAEVANPSKQYALFTVVGTQDLTEE